MHFHAQVIGGVRLGTISDVGADKEKTYETPLCMLYTKSGSVPYLSRDLVQRIDSTPSIVHYCLSNLAESHESIEAFGLGIKKWTAFDEDRVAYCSVYDSATLFPSGYNDKTGCSLWGRAGKIKVDVEQFMKMIESLQPDFYQALCDSDTPKECGKKRTRKSTDRTLSYVDTCLEKHNTSEKLKNSGIFGTIEGGHNEMDRLQCAKAMAKRPVHGFVLEGFHNFGPETEQMNLEDIKSLLTQTIAELPEDKPRLMHHIWTPHAVLQAIQYGIDMFDSSFPYIVAERGGALVFNFSVNSDLDTKKDATEMESQDVRTHPYEINLNDKKYFEDFDPVLKGCTCYTCLKHSRAYINHLLRTSELLAGVLLMMHNIHHFTEFFKAIREAIRQEKFKELKALINEQRS